jgi:hypothetical protein
LDALALTAHRPCGKSIWRVGQLARPIGVFGVVSLGVQREGSASEPASNVGAAATRFARQSATGFARLLSKMPLGRLLGLIVLVTALPLLLATYVSYQRLAANERRSIEQSLLLSTKILAGLVDNEIDEHGAVLKTLAQSRALSRGDLAVFWQAAASPTTSTTCWRSSSAA